MQGLVYLVVRDPTHETRASTAAVDLAEYTGSSAPTRLYSKLRIYRGRSDRSAIFLAVEDLDHEERIGDDLSSPMGTRVTRKTCTRQEGLL